MTRRVFTTTGWNQTGVPIDLGVIDGVQTISYLTIDKAAAACVAGDVVEPCRPGMQGFAFTDADGLPLKTVTVPLGAALRIPRGITLRGGWCRLRLDGVRAYGLSIEDTTYSVEKSIAFDAIDFVNMVSNSLIYQHRARLSIRRCLFANISASYFVNRMDNSPIMIEDTAYIGVRTSTGKAVSWNNISDSTVRRCTFYCKTPTEVPILPDSVVDASGASFVKNKGAASSVTDWSDWETTCDLRLLPTSPYASGATSVTSGQEVYDLAGFKRKVGGALGAYEVLDDTPTHYPCETKPGWRYSTTRDDDTAPTVLNHCVYTNAGGSTVRQIEFPSAASVQRENSGAWTNPSRGSVFRTTLSTTARLFRATYDATPTEYSSFCYIQEYSPSDSAGEGYATATPCKMKWTDGRFFLNGNKEQITSASGAPDSSSVVYLDGNKSFSDDARNVGKIIQEGSVHTDLGGAEGEIILGSGSTAKTSGKLTWRDQTTTSAAALARLTPRAPAELTFKDCAITD